MQVLRDIAASGRTVIGMYHVRPIKLPANDLATIHQPRSDIWQLADNVTLLGKGGLIAVSLFRTLSTNYLTLTVYR
jgi:hypothetical protein